MRMVRAIQKTLLNREMFMIFYDVGKWTGDTCLFVCLPESAAAANMLGTTYR